MIRFLSLTLFFFSPLCASDDIRPHILGGILYPGDIATADLDKAFQKLLSESMPSKAIYDFDTIDMPGIYILDANVSNQITISASNVMLDMNGHTVSGGANGIVINSGLSNITIKNGKIHTVSSDGIQVNAGCSDITICDVEVKNALRAIDFKQVSNSVIKNCDLNLSTTGLELDGCYNVTIRNCTARANTHAGYDLLSSTTCSLLGCQSLSTGDGNSDIQSEVFGFITKDGNGNIFERCIANATQALSVTGSDSIVAGFGLRGSEGCTKIIDSESSNSETNASGVSIPYGIWLEERLNSTESVDGALGTAGNVRAITWSPDGNYLAAGGQSNSSGGLQVYRFNRRSEQLQEVALAASYSILGLDWSPDGQFIAMGGIGVISGTGDQFQVFKFDANSATIRQVAGAIPTATWVTGVAWSPDGNYVAVGGNTLSGTGNELQMFRFDRKSESLETIGGVLQATSIEKVRWSACGTYIAAAGEGFTGGNDFQVIRFDRATGTLTSVDGALGTTGNILGLDWSPDGQYISIGGNNNISGDELQIFTFDRSTETLSNIAGGLTGGLWSVEWSPDSRFLSIGGTALSGSNEYQLYAFDPGSHTLDQRAALLGTAGIVFVSAWSPDGEYIAVGGGGISGSNELQIVRGIQFPQNNVIQNNTVYCNSGGQFPSGIGISGSSITNSVIGNTAFNNPIPRAANEPIVSTNYAFVTNVFNQLFGDAPTLLQNSSMSGIDPILNRYDIPTKLLRLEALAESLIDSLL